MAKPMPKLSLRDIDGHAYARPEGRPALICFVKEDCETCNTAAPVLEAFSKTFAGAVDVVLVGQSGDGNSVYLDRHGLTAPMLDDTGCKASFEWDIEIVPSVFWLDEAGAALQHIEGFVKAEWRALADEIKTHAADGTGDVAMDWDALPDWRPGCGSKHLDPEIHAKLSAEATGSPLHARRIEIASADDVAEFMFDQGFSDGLPLVPPTAERVLRMLEGTPRGAQDVVAELPPHMGIATVEKIAINAVMAGCKPEYLPVVIAAIEAACTDEFNIHGVMATTMGATPVMVVNGPVRHQIGMNDSLGALGTGNRANATIGRAVRLAIRNIGGAKPGDTERSTLSNPMKFTMCFAEREERSPWEPLHVERGFALEDSVVTLFAMTGGPVHIVDQESRTPDQVAGSLGMGLESVFLPKLRMLPVDTLLVVCPEHIDTLMSNGDYSKKRLRERIQTVTRKPMATIVADADSGAGIPADKAAGLDPEKLATPWPKFAGEQYIHLVVAGSDAGKFSSAFHGWATGEIGSVSVSRKIDLG
ncbi:MAG: TlpA family protein disulfide reductase [Pseudomonadota bacterium]